VAGLVPRAGPQALFCHFDPSRGHGVDDLKRFASLGAATGASLALEAVLPLVDGTGGYTDDPVVRDTDVAQLADAVAAAEMQVDRISVSPRAYHSSYQPNEEWPSVPPFEAVYAAVHGVFPKAKLGGGMHSYFTELNRKRPPAHALDFITHTTCPIVHAADDVSVMESLEALPSVMRSAQAMAPGNPYWIGPTAIGMRFNPYGAAPMENPGNARVAMARMDPPWRPGRRLRGRLCEDTVGAALVRRGRRCEARLSRVSRHPRPRGACGVPGLADRLVDAGGGAGAGRRLRRGPAFVDGEPDGGGSTGGRRRVCGRTCPCGQGRCRWLPAAVPRRRCVPGGDRDA